MMSDNSIYKSSVEIEEIFDEEPVQSTEESVETNKEIPKVWKWPKPSISINNSIVDMNQCTFNCVLTIENNDIYYHILEIFNSERKSLFKITIEQYELKLNEPVELHYDNIEGKHGDTITYIVHTIAPDSQESITLIGKYVLPAFKPTPVLTLLNTKTRNSLSYKWNPSNDHGSPILGYSVYQSKEGYWYDDHDCNTIEYECIADTIKGTSFKSTKLLSGHYYYVYTTVTNAIGTTMGSYHCFKTQSSLPCVPSFITDSIHIYDTSIEFVWNELSYEELYGTELSNYILQMDENTGKGFWNVYVGQSTKATVTGLLPKHKYIFRLCAETKEGKSHYTTPLTLTTEQSLCPGIMSCQISKATPFSLYFSWTPSKSHVDEIDNYTIHFHDTTGKLPDIEYKTTSISYTIEGLFPASNYEISINCHISRGWGPYGRVFIFKTLPSIPEAPSLLNTLTTPTSVCISFQENNNNGSEVKEFLIEGIQVCRHPEEVDNPDYPLFSCCDVTQDELYSSYFNTIQENEMNQQDHSLSIGMKCLYKQNETNYIPCYIHGVLPDNKYRILIKDQISFLYTEKECLYPSTTWNISDSDVNKFNYKYIVPKNDIYSNLSINKELHSKCCPLSILNKDLMNVKIPFIPIATISKEECQYDSISKTYKYTISSLIPDTSYLFRIKASNARGWSCFSTSEEIRTSSVVPPAAPIPTLDNVKSTSFELSIHIPSTYSLRGSSILNYIVEMNTLSLETTNESIFECIYKGENNEHIKISNLFPGHTYTLRSCIETDKGITPYSPSVSYETLTNVPDPVVTIKSIPLLQYMNPLTNYHIQWESPERDGGQPITRYLVFLYKENNKLGEKVYEGMDMNYLLVNLFPGENYKIRIQCSNYHGDSLMSSYYSFTTSSSIPSKVDKPLISDHITSTTISIQWRQPNVNGSPITSYEIQVNPGKKLFFVKPNVLSLSISKLKPNTEYSILVSASNKQGMSEWSEPLIAKTEEQGILVPLMTTPLSVNLNDDNDWMIASWGKAEERGAEILNYELYVTNNSNDFICIYDGLDTMFKYKVIENQYSYIYKVRAKNIAGFSTFSNEVSIQFEKPEDPSKKVQKRVKKVYSTVVDKNAAKRASDVMKRKNIFKYYWKLYYPYLIYIGVFIFIAFIVYLICTD